MAKPVTNNLTDKFHKYRLQEVKIDMNARMLNEPVWMDYYDKITDNIDRIHRIVQEVDNIRFQRKESFCKNPQELDSQLEIKISKATELFHDSDKLIKTITKMKHKGNNTIVVSNALKNVFAKLQTEHRLLYKSQTEHITQLKNEEKELHGPIFVSEDLDVSLSKYRHEEIIRLAQNVSELAKLIGELNTLVADQGTIVDRIDYNVEQMYGNIVDANKELVQAEKYNSGTKLNWCMLVLFIVMCILVVIYAWKESRQK
jgi:syntaxin 16